MKKTILTLLVGVAALLYTTILIGAGLVTLATNFHPTPTPAAGIVALLSTPCPQCGASTATLATAEPEISPVATAPEPVATGEYRQQFVQVFLTDTLEISGVDLLNSVYDHWRALPRDRYDAWFHSQVEGAVMSGGAWVRSRDLTIATLGWNQADTEARLLFIGSPNEAPLGAVEFSGIVVDSLCISGSCQVVVHPEWVR